MFCLTFAKSLPSGRCISVTDDGFGVSINHDADFCPECGDPLPEHPSAGLRRAIKEYKDYTTRSPSQREPGGIFKRLSELCVRIKSETDQLTQARKAGWPMQFDVMEFTRRVLCERIASEIRLVSTKPRRSEIWRYLQDTSLLEVLSESEHVIARNIPHDCVGAG